MTTNAGCPSHPRAQLEKTLQPPRLARAHAYVLFLVGLLPLAWCTLHGSPGSPFADRLDQTLATHPELAPGVHRAVADGLSHGATPAQLRERIYSVLPGHRLTGAHLPHDSWAHWLWGLASASVFLSIIVLIFPPHTSRISHLLLVGFFTATLGTLALLGVQWIALRCTGPTPGGAAAPVLAAPYYLLKLLGWAYRAAVGPGSWLASLMGFTLGIALCEELCKALPLLACRRADGWRRACMWALVSGVGFGVSEAIACAANSYNGLEASGVYFMRFISCVALHAIWAASVAVVWYAAPRPSTWIQRLLGLHKVWAVPIVLHGAYDTLLQRDCPAGALVLAVASFAWLAWQIETCLRHDRPLSRQVTPQGTGRVAAA